MIQVPPGWIQRQLGLVRPGDRAIRIVGISDTSTQDVIVPRKYPAEFTRKVLGLVEASRPIAQIAAQLGVAAQTIYNWRNQDLIDRRLRSCVTTDESVELTAARKRLRELEAELAVTRRANELLKGKLTQERFEVVAEIVSEGLPAEVRCRVVEVSVSGFYAWRRRPLSARAVRPNMSDSVGSAPAHAFRNPIIYVPNNACEPVDPAQRGRSTSCLPIPLGRGFGGT